MDQDTTPNSKPSPWQTVLDKAGEDYFTYLMRLKTGEVIHFSKARDVGDYVSLTECQILFPPGLTHTKFNRGMDVRKDAIVWVADEGFIEGI